MFGVKQILEWEYLTIVNINYFHRDQGKMLMLNFQNFICRAKREEQ